MENSCTNLCQNETIVKQSKTSENKTENVKGDSTKNILNQNENERETLTIPVGRIYLITNIINSKKYVGITTHTIEKRFKEHLKEAKNRPNKNIALFRAIRKYGADNFKVELIEQINNITPKNFQLKESEYIEKYNTFIDNDNGYNMVKLSDWTFSISKETRTAMSKASKGRCAGNKSNFFNPKIFLFRNKKTREEFRGTQYDFRKKHNIKSGSVGAIIAGRKCIKGWIVVNDA